MKSNGFTFIEMIIIIAVIASLLGLSTINLLGSQRKALLVEAVDTLISDLQSQQTKAMTGYMVNSMVPSGFGIFFDVNSYVLFSGSSYNPTAPENRRITLEAPIVTGVNRFPNGAVIFLAKSGEVSGFVDGQDSITITESENNQSKTIRINRYGIITDVQ